MALTRTTGQLSKRYIVTKTTTYTATILDDVILCDTSGGAWTLTLPAAASLTGKELFIKKTTSDANLLTIDGNGSETIDGLTTQVLASQYSFYKIFSDGTNWQVINFSNPIFAYGLSNGNNSITANMTNLTFTEVTDSHNAYDGQVFTSPRISDYVFSGSTRWNTNTARILKLYVNGSLKFWLDSNHAGIANGYNTFNGVIRLSATDTMSIRCDTTDTLNNSNQEQHFIVIRSI